MPTSPTELVRDWHDFYVLAGTAAATLAGLMFVAASLGASIFSEEHRGPLRAFLTPTVVHFAAVLFACLLVMIPTQSWQTLGVLLGVLGVAGSAYCARIVVELIIRHRFEVDASDRIFYAVVPFLGYLFVVASAVLFLVGSRTSAGVFAAGLLTLLLAGVRNAWDMTVWIMIRVPTSKGP